MFLSLFCLLLDASHQGNRAFVCQAQAGNAVRTTAFQGNTEERSLSSVGMWPHPSRDGSALLVTQEVEAWTLVLRR